MNPVIISRETVEQPINDGVLGHFLKEVVVCRTRDDHRLSMVRKRASEAAGYPVLLIHGYGQNRYAWHLPSRSFPNYLAQSGFDVFNLDLRGHGRSGLLGSAFPSHVTEFAKQDATAAIDAIVSITKAPGVFVIGHSLGGLVAYASSTLRRQTVRGVITIGSPYELTRGSWALTALSDAFLALDKVVSLQKGALRLSHWGWFVRNLRPLVESPLFPLPFRGFAPGHMEPGILHEHMRLAMDRASLRVIRDMFVQAKAARSGATGARGLLGFSEAFESQALPLLVIAGTRDDLAPVKSVFPAYERSQSPDKSFHRFPLGHSDLIVGRDAPAMTWPLMRQWLRERTPA